MRIASITGLVRGSGKRLMSGEVGRGGGKFREREHAQEEQYFRQKEKEEIEKYRQEMDEAAKKAAKEKPNNSK